MKLKQKQQKTIRIIITGGTFDKQYDELRGELTLRKTHLPEILKQVRCTIPITLEINQLKDSLEMVEEDRRKIIDACVSSEEDWIIITHGTDTMDVTARTLLSTFRGKEKTIVLTGAMIPYSVSGSDAIFNLGCSISAVQLLPHGVYVCMNGKLFPAETVRKNVHLGIFE